MKFYSTNNTNYKVGLEEAVRLGLPNDGGLFMPQEIPQLPDKFLDNLSSLSMPEIGYEILKPFVEDDIDDENLKNICLEAFSFPLPLIQLKDSHYSLELYHGPTLAFKDFGARFMARLLGHFNRTNKDKTTILVATSGDTGSAVADGFFNVENVEVVILYPQGKVSDLQEKQMTTLGGNIHAIAIDGNFDDCQRLVKTAFGDEELSSRYGLTSANSINIARLLPQMLYYFYAYGLVADKNNPMVFSVPSGNYGNLTAGILAKKMGLPVQHFIAATNANDIVPNYLTTGNFEPKPSIETISNAMDVGNPSNFARLQAIFNNSLAEFRTEISGYSYSDDQTRQTIKKVYDELGYVLDPHGAIGYRALEEHLDDNITIGIFLETAHPIKFKQEIEPVIGLEIPIPDLLENVLKANKKSSPCDSEYNDFKKLLEVLLDG
jgi:threonine synthase